MDSFMISDSSALKVIETANDEEMKELLYAIIKKHEEEFPDYELIVFSLPKYDRMRRETELENLKNFMMKHCNIEQEAIPESCAKK